MFEQGVGLMVNENWEVALAQFTRSFDLYPTRSALFNIGMCEKALHRYQAALRHFQEWHERFEAGAPPADLEAVAVAIEDLQQFLGTILPHQRSARGDLSSRQARSSPPSKLPRRWSRMPSGTPSRPADRYETAEQSVLVTPREDVVVSLTLQPQTVAVTPPPVVGPPTVTEPTVEVGRNRPDVVLDTAAAAVALGIGGATAGGVFLSIEDDLDGLAKRCADGDRSACDDGRAMTSDHDDTQVATDVLLFGAGAFAVSALVLAFFTEFDFGEEAPAVILTPTDGGAAVGFQAAF